jgi:glucokinase
MVIMIADAPIVTVDIGGTKIAAALVTSDGQTHALVSLPTEAKQGGEAVIQRVQELIGKLIQTGKTSGAGMIPAAIGVGTAGQVALKRGVIFYATAALPGWVGMPVKDRLEQAFGLPVFVENDANVMALGESTFGAGRGCRHMIGLTVGTGVGGGIIINRRIYHGAHDIAGGIGHIQIDYRGQRQCPCGRYGCLEAYASTQGIVAEYLQAAAPEMVESLDLTPDQLGVKQIAVLAYAGDADAWDAILRGAEYLGVGITTLINLFDPDMVVVGGGIANLGSPYFERVRQVVSERVLPSLVETPILPAQLGERANLVGAACIAWQGLELSRL